MWNWYALKLKTHRTYPKQEEEGDDYVDLGAAILEFYSSLVDLLGKCAPDLHQLQSGKVSCFVVILREIDVV